MDVAFKPLNGEVQRASAGYRSEPSKPLPFRSFGTGDTNDLGCADGAWRRGERDRSWNSRPSIRQSASHPFRPMTNAVP